VLNHASCSVRDARTRERFAFRDQTEGEENVLSAARRNADSIVERLQKAGISANAMVEVTDPKRFLIEEARRWKVDGIFIGAKGHSRLERFLLGGVSAAVAARACCTVEVV